ncbi:hypothetical protein HIM_01868 [Hirsutella minnesotensis 3608]|nr:hypothetical protein HIM_01868 [Hirsutella minnesotensis 3608]
MAPAKIDLSSLASAGNDDASVEGKILDILSDALNDGAGDNAADDAASRINELYPAGNTEAIEDFLWTLWVCLIGAVKKVPADDPRQQLLVDSVARLKAKRDDDVELWGQKTKVWSELPMLGPCMRDAWNMRPKLDGSEKDEAAVNEWTSLNSFAARMFGQDLQSWVNFAIWEMRAALEEQSPESSTAKDASLATACEWIVHAGKALHEQGRQVQKLDAMEERALKPGKLLDGAKSGLSDERWRFWRERIGALGGGAGSGEMKERVQKAIDKMDELEGSA